MSRVNPLRATLYGAASGLAYGAYLGRNDLSAALLGDSGDAIARFSGHLIGGAIAMAFMFGSVALIWNLAGRIRR